MLEQSFIIWTLRNDVRNPKVELLTLSFFVYLFMRPYRHNRLYALEGGFQRKFVAFRVAFRSSWLYLLILVYFRFT